MTESPRKPMGGEKPRLSEAVRAASRATPPASCPTIEAIHDAVAGHASEAERERVRAHAARCGACAAEVALAEAFERPMSAAEERQVDSVLESIRRPLPMARTLRPNRRRVAAFTLAAAAVILLGVTVGPRLFDGDGGRPPIGPPTNVPRGEAVQLESPLGEAKADPLTFRWKAVSGARSYLVAVNAADGSSVLRREVSESSLEIPLSAGDGPFTPGSIYFWEVRAVGDAGADLGRSGQATFRITSDVTEPR